MGASRSRLLVAVSALVLLGASACGGGDAEQGNETGASLQMYAFSSSPAEDAALNTAIANYNKLPDLAKAGALEPIGDRVDNPGDFYDSLKQSFTYQGTYFCPPKDFSTLQLVYNTDELAAAGVKAPTTWQELSDAAQKLTKPGRPALVLNPEFYRWGVFMAQAGAWPTNNDITQMTMDSAQMKQALQYVADMHKAGTAASAAKVGAGWGGEALGKGKAAMTIEGNWIVGAMKTDFPNVKYSVAELPAGPSGKATMAFSVCYGVAQASRSKAAAIDFVKFLTSPEQQLAFTKDFPVMPSRKSIADEWLAGKPELKAFVDGAAYAKKGVFIPGFAAVVDTMNDGIQGLAAGDRGVDQVVSSTQQAGQSVLK